mmetsp:Transcript_15892/g.23935  ORF Transcript_15892/g.23935 Transcript_15892/m.23935 type:complete len:405 (+) Transcript_15892:49-1263(+)
MLHKSPILRALPLRLSRCLSSGVDYSSVRACLSNGHPMNNVSTVVAEKVGRNLHLQPNHPLHIIKTKVESYCQEYSIQNKQSQFSIFDKESPIADTKSCFDDLLVPPDHVSRSRSDTYYIDESTVLRTHTSAHQCQLIRAGEQAFLCSGDVYRRDEIDSSHYPVFHQMEGVRIFTPEELSAGITTAEKKMIIEEDLKKILTGLAISLFGDVEMRWKEDYFPFTNPSFELEILFNGNWLEVLGCGVIHDQVMINADKPSDMGWAFGLGLERLAMVLFDIPDIRLFWSQDSRFLEQFKDGQINKFIPFSKYPFCYKDVSFWIPAPDGTKEAYHENYVYELIRCEAGDIVEKVEKFDDFVHPKTKRHSQAFRVTYRDMSRSLTNEEVDEVQWRVRDSLVKSLGVELR